MTQQEDIISMDNSGAHTDQKNFDEKTSQMSTSKQKGKPASPSVQLEKTKLSRACPVCHGYKVHRTQRSALERWFSRLRPEHRVYLCHECQHRFWAPKNRVPPPLSASKGHPSKGHPSKGHPSKGHPSKGHPSKGHLIRSRSPSASQHFAAWLYRKHGLSIGVLFLLFLTFSAAVFFVWSAMSAL